jgi:hypothetical protein
MTFGEKMRALMAERGMSVRGLARAVPCDPSLISKISRDLERPSQRVAERIDEECGAGGALYALWEPAGAITPDDEDRLARAAQKPSRLDLRVVDSLATILAEWRRTEDVIGSTPLVDPVRSQLATIKRLVIEARGPVRPAIVHVAAQWSQYGGWLTANVGDLRAGRAWLDRALEWATEAGDANLISEVLSFKGHVAWMAEEIGPMIGLSAVSRRRDGLYPGQHAMSAAQQARGHAMAGDAYEAEQLLDEADRHAAAARERADEAPPWLYYHSPGFFELQRGLTYRYLGRYDPAYNRRAAAALVAGLQCLPAEMQRSEWAGEFVYQLGRAHLQAREREPAGVLAAELATLAEQTGSKRLARQAAALR